MNASTSTLIRQAHAATAEVLDLPLPSARRREQPLPSPAELRQHLPLSAAMAHRVREGRDAIRAVLDGRDPRLLVVIGPCSLHDPVSALEYADRLAELAPQVSDQLLLVMRAYVEKPRTTIGWKGLVYDPQLDGSGDMAGGLELSRRLMLGMLERGLPVATELLQPLVAGYFDDLLGWAAIGARTSESQVHREMVSGLDLPVGFKNGTDGSVQVAADAVLAARVAHSFIGMTKMGTAAIFETRGNVDGHVILRGGKRPNYAAEDVDAACALLQRVGLREQVMIDCSHANSAKQPRRQIEVAAELGARIAAGELRILGVMVESHLAEGRQDLVAGQPLRHGVSITDACLGFDDSAALLRGLAQAVRERRRAAG